MYLQRDTVVIKKKILSDERYVHCRSVYRTMYVRVHHGYGLFACHIRAGIIGSSSLFKGIILESSPLWESPPPARSREEGKRSDSSLWTNLYGNLDGGKGNETYSQPGKHSCVCWTVKTDTYGNFRRHIGCGLREQLLDTGFAQLVRFVSEKELTFGKEFELNFKF